MSIRGFCPFVNGDSRILILGSFPSVKSREENFYYGNKQNRFWRTLAQIFGEELPTTVDEKKDMLSKHKIALWDVVVECEIEGSLDADIKNAVVCDMTQIFKTAAVKRIILNGGAAKKYFKKAYPNLMAITDCLPSTSPANTKFDFKIWKKTLTSALAERGKQ